MKKIISNIKYLPYTHPKQCVVPTGGDLIEAHGGVGIPKVIGTIWLWVVMKEEIGSTFIIQIPV
jgi:hypothetical protein